MFIFGGFDGQNSLDDLWMFDLETQQFVGAEGEEHDVGRFAPMVANHTAVVYEEKLYVFGGAFMRNGKKVKRETGPQTWHCYDLATRRWVCLAHQMGYVHWCMHCGTVLSPQGDIRA